MIITEALKDPMQLEELTSLFKEKWQMNIWKYKGLNFLASKGCQDNNR